MDRYTVELGLVVVGVVWLETFLVGPALAAVHPAFGTPVTALTDPDAARYLWRFSVNWGAPRTYLLLALEAAAVATWASWRRTDLRESLRADHGVDVADLEE